MCVPAAATSGAFVVSLLLSATVVFSEGSFVVSVIVAFCVSFSTGFSVSFSESEEPEEADAIPPTDINLVL